MRTMVMSAVGIGLLASGCSLYSSSSAPAPAQARLAVDARASVSVSLTSAQAQMVRTYIGNASPRRRGRNGGLPPGIAKNLSRGKSIPPGIARQYLPAQLRQELPVLPSGLEYLVVAGKLLLVEAATQVIRDVLLDTLA